MKTSIANKTVKTFHAAIALSLALALGVVAGTTTAHAAATEDEMAAAASQATLTPGEYCYTCADGSVLAYTDGELTAYNAVATSADEVAALAADPSVTGITLKASGDVTIPASVSTSKGLTIDAAKKKITVKGKFKEINVDAAKSVVVANKTTVNVNCKTKVTTKGKGTTVNVNTSGTTVTSKGAKSKLYLNAKKATFNVKGEKTKVLVAYGRTFYVHSSYKSPKAKFTIKSDKKVGIVKEFECDLDMTFKGKGTLSFFTTRYDYYNNDGDDSTYDSQTDFTYADKIIYKNYYKTDTCTKISGSKWKLYDEDDEWEHYPLSNPKRQKHIWALDNKDGRVCESFSHWQAIYAGSNRSTKLVK